MVLQVYDPGSALTVVFYVPGLVLWFRACIYEGFSPPRWQHWSRKGRRWWDRPAVRSSLASPTWGCSQVSEDAPEHVYTRAESVWITWIYRGETRTKTLLQQRQEEGNGHAGSTNAVYCLSTHAVDSFFFFMCFEVEMMASNKRVNNRFIKPAFEGKDRVQTQRMKQMVEAHQRPEHGRNRWVFSSVHKDPPDSALFSCARVTRPDGCCKDCFGPARPLLAGGEGQRSCEA